MTQEEYQIDKKFKEIETPTQQIEINDTDISVLAPFYKQFEELQAKNRIIQIKYGHFDDIALLKVKNRIIPVFN